MKIGILTFPHAPSLGAMLQMGALYHTVESLGHDVEIINYVNDAVNHKRKAVLTPKSVIIRILSTLFLKSSKPSFREFESEMKMFPQEPTCSPEMLQEIAARYDRIIVGSDQVWNPVVTGGDLNFYLAFCGENKKKASYAASFGYSRKEDIGAAKAADLLNDFAYLGVREKQGQQLIKEMTGRNASVVLDPTLLTSREYLLSQMQESNIKNKYVLFFCVKPSPWLLQRAKAYAKENGLELVTIGGRLKDRFNPAKHPQFGVGPKEFLGLVCDAECVFTNSFHGMAISIAMQRNFYVEYSSDTNSRLINLVDMFGLQDRVVDNQALLPTDIDYNAVESILEKQREFSLSFLKEILAEEQT